MLLGCWLAHPQREEESGSQMWERQRWSLRELWGRPLEAMGPVIAPDSLKPVGPELTERPTLNG
jgi:hypothetical protein